jgi:glutathione peroxidase
MEKINNKSIYDFSVKTIKGTEKSLSDYKGKVLLIVNTASECGFTPQYLELQELYDKFYHKGFEILGFPSNQFNQEPLSNEEINQFCRVNYEVGFPMFSKIVINGENAHPLFQFLVNKAPGFLNSKPIKWNFTKFLVDRNGNVIKRYAPITRPKNLEETIKELLEQESYEEAIKK